MPANRDVVTDFTNVAGNNDTFRLENAVITKLGAGGLRSTAFFRGAAAHDANDRIVYNQATGALIYDANGNAAGGAIADRLPHQQAGADRRRLRRDLTDLNHSRPSAQAGANAREQAAPYWLTICRLALP